MEVVDFEAGGAASLTLAQRQQVLVEWNATEVPFPHERCVHELIEARVRRDRDAIAVTCGERSLTYSELNSKANRLARHLRAFGVGPDVLVAVCLERSLEMIVGLLAVLKAGGAYVPLDPQYPADRLAFMISDCAPGLVLSHPAARARLDEALSKLDTRPEVIDVASGETAWADLPDEDLEAQAIGLNAGNLIYVIYTSGSTGAPKGVMNEHRGLTNRLVWMQRAYGLTSDDAVLQKTPFGFDVSVWEFFWTLLAGARLVILAPEAHKDPRALIEIIRRERITTIHFVPSMLRAFLSDDRAGACTGLRNVFCSGEALPGPLLRRFESELPSVQLHNLYGPTEAAIDVTAWSRQSGSEASWSASPPIGRPIDNLRIYLLDDTLEPVGIGATGEIFIGGVGVARGYLNRPDLTAARFIPNPYVEGDRLYRTGDLARYLPDGNIEFLERNDFQVKIRGFRVELGEIETRLMADPAVRHAVVVAREAGPGDVRLVAYLVPDAAPGRVPDNSRSTAGDLTVEPGATSGSSLTSHLRTHLQTVLPDYMVPSSFVLLDALPVTANGKLDRNALPQLDAASRPTSADEQPQGELEVAVSEIWAEVLGLDEVGRHENFFELGGHSLLATAIVSRVRQRLAMDVPVRSLYLSSTVASFARVCAESPSKPTGVDLALHSSPIRR